MPKIGWKLVTYIRVWLSAGTSKAGGSWYASSEIIAETPSDMSSPPYCTEDLLSQVLLLKCYCFKPLVIRVFGKNVDIA